MRLAVVILALVAASPAFAQGGPSFDCAKADNTVDRAICKSAALAKADREMAWAYTALLDKLSGTAKDELVKEQMRWIANRNRACGANPDGIEDCLKNRYASRTRNLRAHAQGTSPAISEQSLVKQGKLGKITWSYDIAYPRFEGATTDFATVNARFADAAKKAADDATPKADSRPDLEQQWNYEQAFTVERPPGSHVATIVVQFDGYSGGAHDGAQLHHPGRHDPGSARHRRARVGTAMNDLRLVFLPFAESAKGRCPRLRGRRGEAARRILRIALPLRRRRRRHLPCAASAQGREY